MGLVQEGTNPKISFVSKPFKHSIVVCGTYLSVWLSDIKLNVPQSPYPKLWCVLEVESCLEHSVGFKQEC